jgi:sulfur-carrier protein
MRSYFDGIFTAGLRVIVAPPRPGSPPRLNSGMTIRVLLFGAEAAALRKDAAVVEVGAVGGRPTCADIRAALEAQFPTLRPYLGAGRLAINSEFAAAGQEVREGDEVALIGLVSGG